ncbi:MAG: undecaprenyl-diphosphatase [Polaromonas sp.]
MRDINEALFLWLNAPEQPDTVVLALAGWLANYAIWLVPVILVAGWLRGSDSTRKLMLEATLAGLAGLLMAQAIGLVWTHPRPFMIGLGRTLIPHASDSSFPSDHLTLLWSVAFSFLMHQRTRMAGALLALLGLPVAWARIYLGIHFPFDMVGAAAVAGLASWLCLRLARWFAQPLFKWATAIHRRLFAPLIRRGWMRA